MQTAADTAKNICEAFNQPTTFTPGLLAIMVRLWRLQARKGV